MFVWSMPAVGAMANELMHGHAAVVPGMQLALKLDELELRMRKSNKH